MCLGDWRLGRLIRSQTSTFVEGAAATKALNINLQRVGVRFALNILTTQASIKVLGTGGALCGEATLGAFNTSVQFDLYHNGDLPTREWWIEDATQGDLIFITEFFLPEDVLSTALESIKSGYKPWTKLP